MVLRAMPATFNGYAEKNCRISAMCLVSFDHNRYSVECRHVGQWPACARTPSALSCFVPRGAAEYARASA